MKKLNFSSLDDVVDESEEFNNSLYLENNNNSNICQRFSLRYTLSASFTLLITIIVAISLSLLLSPSHHHSVDAATTTSHGITIHILDTSKGLPAINVNVKIEFYNQEESSWVYLTSSTTNSNGRCDPFWPLDPNNELDLGLYQITFQTKEYFYSQNVSTFYHYVNVVFNVTNSVAQSNTFHLKKNLRQIKKYVFRSIFLRSAE